MWIGQRTVIIADFLIAAEKVDCSKELACRPLSERGAPVNDELSAIQELVVTATGARGENVVVKGRLSPQQLADAQLRWVDCVNDDIKRL